MSKEMMTVIKDIKNFVILCNLKEVYGDFKGKYSALKIRFSKITKIFFFNGGCAEKYEHLKNFINIQK